MIWVSIGTHTYQITGYNLHNQELWITHAAGKSIKVATGEDAVLAKEFIDHAIENNIRLVELKK